MDGFEEVAREDFSKYLRIFYENSEGDWYTYQQLTVGANAFIDTEDSDWEEVEIGRWPGIYRYKDDVGNLWWFDYNYAYQLQGNLSEEEMIEIAESLVKEK